MKAIIAAIGLALAIAPARADVNLLANSDFAEGMTHWKGNFHMITPADRNFSGQIDLGKGAPGMIVDLSSEAPHPGDRHATSWFGLSQLVTCPGGAIDFSVTYQVSNDYQPLDSWTPISTLIDLTAGAGYCIGIRLPIPVQMSPLPYTTPSMLGADFAIALHNVATGES